MTPYDRWLTTEPDTRCDDCDKVLTDDFVEDADYGRVFCNDQCKADYETSRAEAAYERSLERFYGGDGPTTQQEQYEQAWKEKRERSR